MARLHLRILLLPLNYTEIENPSISMSYSVKIPEPETLVSYKRQTNLQKRRGGNKPS